MGSFLHFYVFEKAIFDGSISRNLLRHNRRLWPTGVRKNGFRLSKAILTYTFKPTSFRSDLNATLH